MVKEVIDRIFADPEYKQLFSKDPDSAMVEYKLTAQETEMIKKAYNQVSTKFIKTCEVCGKKIYNDVWYANLVIFEMGSTRQRKSEFFFHPECYQEGKKQVMKELGKLPSGGGVIQWDSRDPDPDTEPVEALTRTAFYFPRMKIIFQFIKQFGVFILILILALYWVITKLF